MSTYIIRNGGFQSKLYPKPDPVKSGTIVTFRSGACFTLTKGRKYTVLGHFCYLNTYGARGGRYAQWDEFYTLKNDIGYTIKVSARNFSDIKPSEISTKN